MKSPAFQFYPNDFLGGVVAAYTLEEVGLYSLLLAFDWNLNGLPTDAEKLAKMTRVSSRKFHTLWKTVGENFTERDGRYFNARLQLEREKQAEWRDKSAKGGKASAAKRGSRVVEPEAQPKGNTTSSTPSTTPVTALTAIAVAAVEKRAKPKQEAAPWMGRMCEAWTLGTLPPGSATLLRPVVAAVGEDETVARLEQYVATKDPDFATIRDFVAKHATYADRGPRLAVDPLTGFPNAVGIAALTGRR